MQRHAASRVIELGKWSWVALSLCVIGLPLGLLLSGYEQGRHVGRADAQAEQLSAAEADVRAKAAALAELGQLAEQRLQAMSLSLAQVQARMTRIDALGMHLTDVAGLDETEFDFQTVPAVGGPSEASELLGSPITPDFLRSELAAVDALLSDRESKLTVLSQLVADQRLAMEASPTGRPVSWGWQSSAYGSRIDPFSGERAWHQGIDFAGREGSEIIAVASGVVSFSGERAGYGTMVEIAHGDGLSTRYAHNQENLVAAGDVVRKGDAVALMGSSGRSTGPHVHFEVYKHGRPVDPSSYIRRTHR
jgi:murein DD-endopeptidase MepM/ murein hydrolase activator NlpD